MWPRRFNGLEKTKLEPKFEVSISKNKDLVTQCTFQKVWKILLLSGRFFQISWPSQNIRTLLYWQSKYYCQDVKRCFKIFHSVQDGNRNNHFVKLEKTNEMWSQKDFDHIVDLAWLCSVRQQGCVILHPRKWFWHIQLKSWRLQATPSVPR